jgi:periplasmic protein TonB
MSAESTPAESRERRHGPARASLLAVSILLHVVALEILLLATAGGGGGSRGMHEQPIDAVFLPPAAAAGGAPPASAATSAASAAEQRAAKERQAMLDRLVQPAAIPDSPGTPGAPASPGTTDGPSAAGTVAGGGGETPRASGAPDGGALPADAGGYVTRPEIVESSRILPDYPEAAQRAGREGVVVIKAIIDEQGKVTDPRILRGLDPVLDDAALAAVRHWKFRPATRSGKPVRVNYILTVDFRL